MTTDRRAYRDDTEALLDAERRLDRELGDVRGRLAAKQPFELVQLRLARPCDERWEGMEGDERRRFCASCKQDVWNVAELTHGEVMELVGASACFRMLHRGDGTLITKECRTPIVPARFVLLAAGTAAVATAALTVRPPLTMGRMDVVPRPAARGTAVETSRDTHTSDDATTPTPATSAPAATPLTPPPRTERAARPPRPAPPSPPNPSPSATPPAPPGSPPEP